MKRTMLLRRTPLRRRRPRPAERIDPDTVLEVMQRDAMCVAARLDPVHSCEGRLTLEHVPERGKNALGRKAPDDRYHLITLCLGANSGGTKPWAETHREDERRYLAMLYPDYYGERDERAS